MSPFQVRASGLALALLAFFLCTGFRPWLSTSDTGGERLSHKQGLALAALYAGPQVGARAAILYDVAADAVIYEHNAHEQLAPASTTKIATALVVLKRMPLTQVVTVGSEVEVAGMRVGLSAGDSATVEKLLYALLMNSGNDAAMALAKAAGGTIDQFMLWMNDEAAQRGLRNTHFANPHGLDEPGHYSSAYDMMLLSRAAMENPVFASIVSTQETVLDGWTFVNRNELLGQYPGIDGVKTGTTPAAGECLVASVVQHGQRVIVVVLGSADRYADARMLLDFYYKHHEWVELQLPANRFSYLEPDENGRPRYLLVEEEAGAVIPSWQVPWLKFYPHYGMDEMAGQAGFFVGRRLLGRLPLAIRTI